MAGKINIKANQLRREGTLFVISAPSGAGKTTLCQKLLKNIPTLKLSVSFTTRPSRKGEINDLHYTFVTEKKFKNMIERGEFAEWATVHGNLYGTSIKRLKKLNREGYDIILDIDTRGAMQLQKSYNNAVYIFVLPPSMKILESRLVGRRTDAGDIVNERLNNAKAEIMSYSNYDYIIVNDKLDVSYKQIESVVLSTKLRTEKINKKWIESLIKHRR